MTISSETRKAGPFTGNGATTVFPFTFKVFAASDLYVVRATDTGIETVLDQNAGDYTVSLNANQDVSPGGSITLPTALATDYLLTITSDVANKQETDITNQGGFYPQVIEDALDRATIQIQQVDEQLSRALKLPLTTDLATVDLSLPAPESNKFIGWNSDADALQNIDAQTLATIVAYGQAQADIFTGDGVTTQFTLTQTPVAQANLDVAVGGVVQLPGTDYTWTSGTTLVFASAPPNGEKIIARYMQGLPFGEIADGSISSAKFTPSAVPPAVSGASGSSNVGFVHSGTGASTRTAQDKLRDTASPKDFGAVADGATNAATALQALFAAKDHISASFADTYAISTGLTVPRDNMTIEGLKLKPTTTGNMTALTVGPTSPDASTTLSVNAAAFDLSVTLSSATGFAIGKLVLFTFTNPTWSGADPLAASYQFVTRVIGVSGPVITLQDALPHAIQSGWTHSVQAWTPRKNPRIRVEIDQSAQGQKRTITAITQANPAVFTTDGAHGYTTGVTVDINGPITGMTQMRSARAVATVLSPTTFSLPIDASGYSAYTSGATVRQTGTGLLLGCVEGGEIEIVGYDNDGAGALLEGAILYGTRVTFAGKNCGNGSRGDIHTTAYTNCRLNIVSDGSSGFGPTLLGGHYSSVDVAAASRAALGRGVKTGKSRFNTYRLGSVNNPGFTAVAAAWVTQDCDFYLGAVVASTRFATQPGGFWTSGCYNTGLKVFGMIARGSTSYDAQVNSTDSVEFVGCFIDKLDMPSGADVTMVGGGYTTLSGAASGGIKLLTAQRVKLSGNQVLQLTDATFGYPVTLYGSGANGMSMGATSGGDGTFFTDREVLRLLRGAPTSGQTGLFLVYHNGATVTFSQVTLGAADSGGAGFKALRVPN